MQKPSAIAHTKSPESQEESWCSSETMLFAQTVKYSELFLSVRVVGTLPKFKLPDPSQGPNLPAGFSIDSILRPAMLTLFYTDFDRDCIDSVDQFEENCHLNIKYFNQ